MSRNILPTWFKLICCSVPLVALLVTTMSIACGVAISPIVFAVVATLAWRVIAKVLGISPTPLVVSIPSLRRETEKLTE